MTTKTKSLTEIWFTEILGWKTKPFPNFQIWHKQDGTSYYMNKLPDLTDEITGLSLQEKWVWPLLREMGIDTVSFKDQYDPKGLSNAPRIPSGEIQCRVRNDHPNNYESFDAWESTKPKAQLEAALKAMGKR